MFVAADIGRVLEITDIRSSIENFDSDEKGKGQIPTPGGPQNVIVLTREGVYRVVMRSNKAIARPFQKWLTQILKSIENTGKYDAQEHLEMFGNSQIEDVDTLKKQLTEKTERIEQLHTEKNVIELLAVHMKERSEIQNSKTMVDANESRAVMYIGKINNKITPHGHALLKIGSSADLRSRVVSLTQDYGIFHIVRAFATDKHKEFERYMHTHQFIRRWRFNDAINGKKSTEVFSVPLDMMNKIISIASRNANRFRESDSAKELKQLNSKMDAVIAIVQNMNSSSSQVCDDMIDAPDLLDNHTNFADIAKAREKDCGKRGRQNELGRKIQIYDVQTGALIRTFYRMKDVLKDVQMNALNVQPTSIRNAILQGTKYKGFRWASLDPDNPDTTVQELTETIVTKKLKTGPVAELNKEGTAIVRVVPDRHTLAKEHGYSFVSGVIKRLNAKKLIHGRRYAPYDAISSELKQQWIAEGGVLPSTMHANARAIQRLHPKTLDVIETYDNQASITTTFECARTTLYKAINGDLELRGYKWRFVGTDRKVTI